MARAGVAMWNRGPTAVSDARLGAAHVPFDTGCPSCSQVPPASVSCCATQLGEKQCPDVRSWNQCMPSYLPGPAPRVPSPTGDCSCPRAPPAAAPTPRPRPRTWPRAPRPRPNGAAAALRSLPPRPRPRPCTSQLLQLPARLTFTRTPMPRALPPHLAASAATRRARSGRSRAA